MNPFTGGEHYETGYKDDFPISSSINKNRKVAYLKNVQLSIITPSRWMETLARQSAVFAGKKIKTVRNPADIAIFNIKKGSVREKYGISPNKKIILFVAENPQDKRKGFDLLLSSLEKVRKKDGFHLLVIGDSTNMPAMSFSHTFAGSVHVESLMAEIYSSADLFIIPSREDNLPNTVSESLLCGTPVAAFHTGGIPEMVKEGVNGYLCHDSQNLAEVIENLQVSSFDKNKVRESVLVELDPEKLYTAFMETYRFW
jgi:glycosyltransferase involved in cell wall biosynthesis